jgi:putative radical SAM enzyme (TIGR03279 family)
VSIRGVKIRVVEAASPAHRAGLAPGDEIVAVNGNPVPDELALKFFLAESEHVELALIRADGRKEILEAELAEDRGLGVEVEDFRTRTCNNACLFCFVEQLPPNARKSLKIKDDDFRLSFLHGNYITLTNLNDGDLDRIITQALSPLYISVHATDPGLRARILGRKRTDDLAAKIRCLIAGGIRIHAQIVLMPQINDGEHLRKTVFDLYSWHPGVHSVAVVPLGLSAYRRAGSILIPVTPPFCREIMRQVTPWQRQFRKECGRAFVYLADEFYIQGKAAIPGAGSYDDFAQIEDGVGMARQFLDDFAVQMNRRRGRLPKLRGTLATGRLFYPHLRRCAAAFNHKFGAHLQVIAVKNQFLGKSITVAGLLAGQDFIAALGGRPLGDFVIIPQETVSQVEGIFLDGQSPEDVGGRLGIPVITGGRTVSDFFSLLYGSGDWLLSHGTTRHKARIPGSAEVG